MAVCQKYDMHTGDGLIPGIATGFAGGIGNTGSVCGAVAGAIMAIGMKQGRAESMDGMLRNLEVSGEFRRRFEAEMKSINCRDLTGYDLSTEDGLSQYMSSDKPKTVCFPAVGASYRLVVELLKEIEN